MNRGGGGCRFEDRTTAGTPCEILLIVDDDGDLMRVFSESGECGFFPRFTVEWIHRVLQNCFLTYLDHVLPLSME